MEIFFSLWSLKPLDLWIAFASLGLTLLNASMMVVRAFGWSYLWFGVLEMELQYGVGFFGDSSVFWWYCSAVLLSFRCCISDIDIIYIKLLYQILYINNIHFLLYLMCYKLHPNWSSTFESATFEYEWSMDVDFWTRDLGRGILYS